MLVDPNIANIGVWGIDWIPQTVWAGVELIVGIDQESHMEKARMPMMARNDIGGTSTKNAYHWARSVVDQKFGPLDDETMTIIEEYDTSKLKESLANTHIQLFVGSNDALVYSGQDKHRKGVPSDFDTLMSLLPDHTVPVHIEDYNHLDYMWAKDANEFVNTPALDFLKSIQ
jgi:hypothetical protein